MMIWALNGKAEIDATTLDLVLDVLATSDPHYYAVTKLGRCEYRTPGSPRCDCLRCEHEDGLTEFDYPAGDGTRQTAYVWR